MKARIVWKGGTGSGNFGHEGRPGEVGGSITTGGSNDQVVEDVTTPTHVKRFLKNRVEKAAIISALQSVGADKLKVHMLRGKPGAMMFYANMNRRSGRKDEAYDYSLNLEIYDDNKVRLYPTGLRMSPTWLNGAWKTVAKAVIGVLGGKGFDYMTLPVPDDKSNMGHSYKRVKL